MRNTPPIYYPQEKPKKLVGIKKYEVLKEITVRFKNENTLISTEKRKERLEDTYLQSIRRMIEIFTWQYLKGNLRSDGYFYTTYGGLSSYQCIHHKRTTKRHITHLYKRGIIKDIDRSTPGPCGHKRFRYGFWIRLEDSIVEGILLEVSKAQYNIKKEYLKKEQQQKGDAKSRYPQNYMGFLEERHREAVEFTSDEIIKQIEQQGFQYPIKTLISYTIATTKPDKELDSP